MRFTTIPSFFISAMSATFFASSLHAAMPKSSIETRFANATATGNFVTALKTKIIPAELKNVLLDSSRAEDKAYAKDLVVHWKAYQDKNLHAEFDELVTYDDTGKETLRIRPVETSTDSFFINGKIWSTPKTGSVRNSLAQHLGKFATGFHTTNKEASIFAQILSPAIALAAPFASDITPVAFVYVVSHRQGDVLFNLQGAAEFSGQHLARSFLSSLFGSSIEIQCDGYKAQGTAVIDGENIAFESRGDGSVILTMNNAVKTKLLVFSTTERVPGALIIHDKMSVARCLDARCTRVDKTSLHETPLAWIAHDKPTSDDVAGIENGMAKSAMAALRPLGACCGDASCRKALAERDIKFVPASKTRLTR